MLSVLANRTYRHLFAAQVIALIGTGMLTVALGLLAYRLAGAEAGAVLGTALAIKMVAYVLVAPVANAFPGQLPRRAFLAATDGDNTNLVVAQIAARRFNVRRVIVRVMDPYRAAWYAEQGVRTICPTQIAIEQLEQAALGDE